MADRPPMPKSKPKPTQTPQALAAQEERRAREAAALRENLRRRKQQLRGRAATDAQSDPGPDPVRPDESAP